MNASHCPLANPRVKPSYPRASCEQGPRDGRCGPFVTIRPTRSGSPLWPSFGLFVWDGLGSVRGPALAWFAAFLRKGWHVGGRGSPPGGRKTWAKSWVERPPGLSAWGMRRRGAEVFVAEAHGVRARFLRAAIFFSNFRGAPSMSEHIRSSQASPSGAKGSK